MHQPKLIILKEYKDQRGNLIKFYKNNLFSNYDIVESFYSLSKKNVFRGMHYQLPPFDVNKIVHCFHGEVLDFIVDLRKNSKTYKKITRYHLTQKKPSILIVPKGFAHGFLTLSKISGLLYFYDKKYSKKYESGFNYQSLGFFGAKKIILSKRDKTLKHLNLK